MAERFDGDEIDVSAGMGARMEAVRRLEGTARALKLVAVVAGVLWAVVTLALFWTHWDLSSNGRIVVVQGELSDDGRLVRVVGQSLQATWGWALVAVVAAASSGLITLQRLRFGGRGLDGE